MTESKKKKERKIKTKTCKMCGTWKGLVRKYKLNICRRCFKDNAKRLGFEKYD